MIATKSARNKLAQDFRNSTTRNRIKLRPTPIAANLAWDEGLPPWGLARPVAAKPTSNRIVALELGRGTCAVSAEGSSVLRERKFIYNNSRDNEARSGSATAT